MSNWQKICPAGTDSGIAAVSPAHVLCPGHDDHGLYPYRFFSSYPAAPGFSVESFLPIRYWEMPRCMIYLYILALVMKYWGVTREIDWLNIIGMNLSQLAYFFLCVQGIALILYLISRRFQLRNGLQALILILFFVMPVFSYAAFVAGIFDMLANYRKKRLHALVCRGRNHV